MKKIVLFCIISWFFGIATASELNNNQSSNSADEIYNKKLIIVTKSLFYKLKLNMSYNQAVKIIGKPPLFCTDQKNLYCKSDDKGMIDKKCLDSSFIQKKLFWVCHWDGQWTGKAGMSSINLSFNTNAVTYIMVATPDGTIFAKKSDGSLLIQSPD